MKDIPFRVYDFFAYLASGFLIVATIDSLHGRGWLSQPNPTLAVSLLLILISYVVGQVVAQLSAPMLESLFAFRMLGRPSIALMAQHPRSWRRLFPLYYRPLPRVTQERILTRTKDRGFEGPGEGLFLHAFGVVKHDHGTLARLEQFRDQYGFARNMTFALLATAVLIWFGPSGTREAIPSTWAWVSCALAVVMLYRYLKFFRQYSYELLVTYAEFPSSGVQP